MPHRTLVIVNPQSRNGATRRRWSRCEAQLRSALGAIDVETTRAPRDAERLAREAARAGIERLIVAGGDGTLSEVATGLIDAGLADAVEIGLLPLGTGGDFARVFGVPPAFDAAVRCLENGASRRVDAGRACFADAAGEKRSACFVNVASLGISGLVDEIANESSKALGGKASFLTATLRALARYRAERVTIRVDGELVSDAPLLIGAFANGRCFGGGMQIAPRAELDDGLLDVVVVPDLPKLQLLRKLPALYRGTHIDDPAVLSRRGRCVEAESPSAAVRLELDGEPLGRLPVRLEVLPGALRIIGPPP